MKLFAIEVTHTQKGKPRKQRVFATFINGQWRTTVEYHLISAYEDRHKLECWLGSVQSILRCRCKIVEFVEVK